MKTSKTLIAFCIVYTIITLYFISDIQRDQSASLGYVFIFPFFWIVAGVILGFLFWFKKIRLTTIWDKILFFFSTPLALLIPFVILGHFSTRYITSSSEYNKNGHRHREIHYDYSAGGQTQRIEYYISQDTVTDSEPFPKNDIWLKDSIWTYYNKDGTIQKREDHTHK